MPCQTPSSPRPPNPAPPPPRPPTSALTFTIFSPIHPHSLLHNCLHYSRRRLTPAWRQNPWQSASGGAAASPSARNRVLLPYPPSLNSLKRKLDVSSAVVPSHDSGILVVVRIRPLCRVNEEAGED
ncbi:unnamed protein product [Urochloa humidicola]